MHVGAQTCCTPTSKSALEVQRDLHIVIAGVLGADGGQGLLDVLAAEVAAGGDLDLSVGAKCPGRDKIEFVADVPAVRRVDAEPPTAAHSRPGEIAWYTGNIVPRIRGP